MEKKNTSLDSNFKLKYESENFSHKFVFLTPVT